MMEAGNNGGDYTSLANDGRGAASQQPMANSAQHDGELDLDSGRRRFKESRLQVNKKYCIISLMIKLIVGKRENRLTRLGCLNFLEEKSFPCPLYCTRGWKRRWK